MSDFDDDDIFVLGSVLDAERGSLPYALIHGEALVACAAWALGEAGVQAIDLEPAWEQVVDAELPLVLHDSLCPMTPPEFIRECVAAALADEVVVVGVRPVTDTVKELADGFVGETVDRDELVAVCSPVVLPAAVVASLTSRPGDDLARLVVDLRTAGHDVRSLMAPAQGRRVADADDLRLLEALTAPTV